ITEELVVLDLEAPDRHAATRALGERLAAAGRVTDLDGFLADVRKREEQMATGLPGGIGIPHARSAHVTAPTLGFGRSANGADVEVRDRARFQGKPLVTRSVKKAISDAPGTIAAAVTAAEQAPAGTSAAPALSTKVETGAGIGTRLRQWLMTGVSYMIPFVAA